MILFGNEKGGVTKTTTTAMLSAILATQLGYRVLVIGGDPQSNIENLFGFLREDIPDGHTLFDVLQEKCTLQEAILPTTLDPATMNFFDHRTLTLSEETPPLRGPDLVPSNLSATDADFILKAKDYWNEVLRDALEPFRMHYDYIFMDSAPSLGAITFSGFTAADFVVIPIVPERLAVEGVLGILGVIKRVQRKANPGLKVAGFILSKVQNWKSHRTMTQDFKEFTEKNEDLRTLNLRIFEAEIKQNAEFANSLDNRSLIVLDNPENDHARAYWYVLDELLQIIEGPAKDDVHKIVQDMKTQDQDRQRSKGRRKQEPTASSAQ